MQVYLQLIHFTDIPSQKNKNIFDDPFHLFQSDETHILLHNNKKNVTSHLESCAEDLLQHYVCYI